MATSFGILFILANGILLLFKLEKKYNLNVTQEFFEKKTWQKIKRKEKLMLGFIKS